MIIQLALLITNKIGFTRKLHYTELALLENFDDSKFLSHPDFVSLILLQKFKINEENTVVLNNYCKENDINLESELQEAVLPDLIPLYRFHANKQHDIICLHEFEINRIIKRL